MKEKLKGLPMAIQKQVIIRYIDSIPDDHFIVGIDCHI